MGCDIHLFVEFCENASAPWKSADVWEEDETDPGKFWVTHNERFYSDRNYNLFAILADVRNGHGFAGIKTGEGFKPIASPRGLPPDVTASVKTVSDRWASDGHSHSYHTLADLLAYDWTQQTILQGWMSGPEYLAWQGYNLDRGLRSQPRSYSGGVSGGAVKHIEVSEMRASIEAIREGKSLSELHNAVARELAQTYCCPRWGVSYYDAAGDFFGTLIPRLLRLGAPNDVRIVFFFDN